MTRIFASALLVPARRGEGTSRALVCFRLYFIRADVANDLDLGSLGARTRAWRRVGVEDGWVWAGDVDGRRGLSAT